MVTLQFKQISIPPGQRVLLQNISWGEFEGILSELGEHRAIRLSYYQGILELRMPLPEHEVNKEIIGDMVKILLEELEIDRECFGSTTFKREDMPAGIEPDNCFYIKNYRVMIGKKRIDLRVDPPPDLAIEVDLISKTQLAAYEALGVSELWRYENEQLHINVLQEGKYIESSMSSIFPNIPVREGISQFLKASSIEGTSAALRGFRKWVTEMIN
ncbi:protein of unknown function DUF820 [Gloeothece citriformis PCC 7424]|uniref:Putative restriction endonuclease domain-containing protein n=1 Tax=Gloeothece citriformis (strain PCC 7424) TaxID=65393 RepID=B7KKX6_GLOC7|nr:Uma2 family endonuclease [Gloeothece citriformis]ACK71095.1 protein of unknown function DUF820 [Gloeothece citriformis PCC 7424]